MLKDEILVRISRLGECDFTIPSLFSPEEWEKYPVKERRGAGRWNYGCTKKGIWNKDGWIVEPLPNKDHPCQYSRRRIITLSSGEGQKGDIKQKAIDYLTRLLDDKDAPPHIKLTAAVKLLDLPAT